MTFLSKILALVSLLFASSDFKVGRGHGSDFSVAIEFAVERDKELRHRLEQGLEVRYRYAFRLCRKRSLWLDHCGDSQIRIKRIKLDPLSQGYRIVSDRLGDTEEPAAENYPNYDEAVSALARIDLLELSELEDGDDLKDTAKLKKSYLSMRLESSCREESLDTLDRISYLMTLGIVDVTQYDTDWVDMSLRLF